MISRLVFFALVVAYLVLLLPFAGYLKERPVEVKLGYLPHPQLLKIATGTHAPTVAQMTVVRVLFYFGTILQKLDEKVIVAPEFANMYRTLLTASELDPYNMDVYYFAQAAFTWELGRIAEVNHLLERGMQHRTRDFWLPYYLGFNNAYFLKDYQKAAVYYQKAAELSGDSLLTKLAARYFYEAEQTALGLVFLEAMIKGAKDPAIRKTYELRHEALQISMTIDAALQSYKDRFGRNPERLETLIETGLLSELPKDPYGGEFYLDENGKVRSTSKFAELKSQHRTGE